LGSLGWGDELSGQAIVGEWWTLCDDWYGGGVEFGGYCGDQWDAVLLCGFGLEWDWGGRGLSGGDWDANGSFEWGERDFEFGFCELAGDDDIGDVD